MRMTLVRLALAVASIAPVLSPAVAQTKPPLVLAAASLQESLTEAGRIWAAQEHVRPVVSFAASSALARQIAAGSPADIFISADTDWMDDVQKRGLVRAGTRAPFLGNRLVLIAPAASRGGIAIRRGFALARALGTGRLAMADPAAVPAGKYGQAALTALGVWPSVQGRVAKGDSVRAALALVASGNAPYGIVYETDARASRNVRIVGVFPAASHPPITYPIAVLTTASSPDTMGFRRFLTSPAGRAIFRRFGFTAR